MDDIVLFESLNISWKYFCEKHGERPDLIIMESTIGNKKVTLEGEFFRRTQGDIVLSDSCVSARLIYAFYDSPDELISSISTWHELPTWFDATFFNTKSAYIKGNHEGLNIEIFGKAANSIDYWLENAIWAGQLHEFLDSLHITHEFGGGHLAIENRPYAFSSDSAKDMLMYLCSRHSPTYFEVNLGAPRIEIRMLKSMEKQLTFEANETTGYLRSLLGYHCISQVSRWKLTSAYKLDNRIYEEIKHHP
ncbi:MAG: hypothetical protein NDI94_03525 [Candidatus Woesearchaeota archaeon]|nr:hypothetical protein [Candidatus Woesearchaeota archaeon]